MPPRSRRTAPHHHASPLDQLTPQQLAFVRLYVANGGNAFAAYDAAYEDHGGSLSARRSSASQLARNPRIKAAIDHMLLDTARVKVVDRNLIVSRMLRNSESAYEVGDIQASNRALELLGKAIGDVFDVPSDDAALDLVRTIRGLAKVNSDSTGEMTVTEYRQLPAAPGS